MEQISLTYMLIGAIVILLVVGLFWVRKSSKLSQKLAVTETQLSEAATTIEEYKEKYSQIFDIEAEC
ncbi:hypothetical protein CGJ28_26610, partial [Vibrio parahaemolyticus]